MKNIIELSKDDIEVIERMNELELQKYELGQNLQICQERLAAAEKILIMVTSADYFYADVFPKAQQIARAFLISSLTPYVAVLRKDLQEVVLEAEIAWDLDSKSAMEILNRLKAALEET